MRSQAVKFEMKLAVTLGIVFWMNYSLSPHFIGLLDARENRLSNRKGQNTHQYHLNVSILEWDAGVSLHLRL